MKQPVNQNLAVAVANAVATTVAAAIARRSNRMHARRVKRSTRALSPGNRGMR